MRDMALEDLLSSRGFRGEAVKLALDELCRHGLTRPGKSRIAVAKIESVDNVLGAAFRRHCKKPACRPVGRNGRRDVLVSAEYCEVCGGSDNRRAVDDMLTAMRRAGLMRLLVVGGSPGTRQDLKRYCRDRCELDFVTEETNPRSKVIGSLLRWSDVTVIWSSTEISHKATAPLRGSRKIVRVPRRGVAALAQAVRDYCCSAG